MFSQRVWLLAGLSAVLVVSVAARAAEPRVTRSLQVLYTFDDVQGDVVRDRSGVGRPLNLRIEKAASVQRRAGSLVVRSSAKIASAGPAAKLITAVKQTSSISIEAWIRPASDRQEGPARIVTLSDGPNARNFTLGQDGKRYDVRFRTSATSSNGIPSTASPNNSLGAALTHVVYTRDRNGNAKFFLNGKQRGGRQVGGDLRRWNGNFKLALANEFSGDRPWLGEFHLVAVYNRSLTPAEVVRNFKAGAGASRPPAQIAQDQRERFFETRVAPLFARKCLDCHDSATKKGGLDLARKVNAFAGGESGKAIAAGDAGKSHLWELVSAAKMPPKDSEPLTSEERLLIKKWIDDGAAWSRELIDPVVYTNDNDRGQLWLQRLTVVEYIETVRSAVGVDIAKEAREILPRDLRADGFSNTAYNLNVDLKHVEAYSQLAAIIVERMDMSEFASRFSKSRSLSTDATMRKFVAAMGKWLLRGPLDERETTNYSGIATTVASAGGDYDEAVGLIVEAMLQSPRFIYRVENQRGDGTPWPADPHELASRLSYIVWGAPPDAELLRAADSGALGEKQVVAAQVARMLQDPRAIDRSCEFVSEWLNLNRLENLQPNAERFPSWRPGLGGDMRDETIAFFKEVVWKQNRPLADLFDAQFTFATPRLAKHYGLKPQGGGPSEGLKRYDLSNVPARGGLLTQGSVLTVGGDDASMISRGLFVLNDVLRGAVKDPPPGLDTAAVPAKPGVSARAVSEKRISAVACGGCHIRFEPLAFGLEKFDGVGAFREQDEHGNQLREDGEILFPGAAKAVKYQKSSELMTLLADSGRVSETITWKVTQFALGRPLVSADARTVEQIDKEARQGGGTYASLITAIVTSDLVRMTRTQPAEAESP
ncbi:MAG: DUF1592 domain-containing protein [Pirellulaceae bacterium]|nr:DUF1592 domain-containing protein [Pirellulaceae bacterium]MDP7015930.1 DUF1592 domain-containing protein [Pirellulaceae bacterium]